MVNLELPPGASVERTDEVMKEVADACLETDGVAPHGADHRVLDLQPREHPEQRRHVRRL